MVMTSSSQTSSDHPHDAPHAGDNTPGITEPSTSGGDVTMKKHEPKREVQNEFSKSEPEEESETKEDRKVVEAASSTKKVLEVGYEPNNEDVICSWARQNVRTPNESRVLLVLHACIKLIRSTCDVKVDIEITIFIFTVSTNSFHPSSLSSERFLSLLYWIFYQKHKYSTNTVSYFMSPTKRQAAK